MNRTAGNAAGGAASKKQSLFAKYNSSRIQLLVIVAFTVVNVVFLAMKADRYFLFSAAIPYILVMLGMTNCGMLPEEYYGADYKYLDFYGKSFFFAMLAIAVLITAVYLLCFFMSKKHGAGWLAAALALFTADTVAMLIFYGFDSSMIVDILFHVLFIAYMVYGIVNYYKWKKAPDPSPAGAESVLNGEYRATAEGGYGEEFDPDFISPVLRVADPDVKARTLCKADYDGHIIEYRRVKRVNELVIDGHVYDEVEMLAETPHTLSARVFGHTFTAGIGFDSHSTISVDGNEIARKLRLI